MILSERLFIINPTEKSQIDMTEDKFRTPWLREKGINGKRIYYHQKYLESFKQYTKRKTNIDVTPLIKKNKKKIKLDKKRI